MKILKKTSSQQIKWSAEESKCIEAVKAPKPDENAIAYFPNSILARVSSNAALVGFPHLV